MQDKIIITIGNKSFRKYGKIQIFWNDSKKSGIKSRLHSGSACCHSFPNLLSTRLLSKNCNIASCFLWVKIWSPTLVIENRLRVSENRMLRRMFGPTRGEMMWDCRKLKTEELHKCAAHQILLG